MSTVEVDEVPAAAAAVVSTLPFEEMWLGHVFAFLHPDGQAALRGTCRGACRAFDEAVANEVFVGLALSRQKVLLCFEPGVGEITTFAGGTIACVQSTFGSLGEAFAAEAAAAAPPSAAPGGDDADGATGAASPLPPGCVGRFDAVGAGAVLEPSLVGARPRRQMRLRQR